jgi:hypothetical protein
MSLDCCSSKIVPKACVISADGYLYDQEVYAHSIMATTPTMGTIIHVAPYPKGISPTIGTPSRNIFALLSLMRAEMDRISIDSFRLRGELLRIQDRIDCERERRRKSIQVIEELSKNN